MEPSTFKDVLYATTQELSLDSEDSSDGISKSCEEPSSKRLRIAPRKIPETEILKNSENDLLTLTGKELDLTSKQCRQLLKKVNEQERYLKTLEIATSNILRASNGLYASINLLGNGRRKFSGFMGVLERARQGLRSRVNHWRTLNRLPIIGGTGTNIRKRSLSMTTEGTSASSQSCLDCSTDTSIKSKPREEQYNLHRSEFMSPVPKHQKLSGTTELTKTSSNC